MTKKPFGEPVHANAPDPNSAEEPERSGEWIDDAADILRTIEGEAAYREVLQGARANARFEKDRPASKRCQPPPGNS
jgi:hypothetical protein